MTTVHRITRLVGGFAVASAAFLGATALAGPNNKEEVFDLSTVTIAEITTAMNSKALTSVELVGMYLRRVQAYDQTSPVSPAQPLNSILALSPDLLEDAADADRMRKHGTVLGPLHGIPF